MIRLGLFLIGDLHQLIRSNYLFKVRQIFQIKSLALRNNLFPSLGLGFYLNKVNEKIDFVPCYQMTDDSLANPISNINTSNDTILIDWRLAQTIL